MDVEQEFIQFVNMHTPQLVSSGVPEHFWRTLYAKLCKEIFDSANVFQLMRIDYGEEERPHNGQVFQLQIGIPEGISAMDPTQIYLIDHAWTFRVNDGQDALSRNDELFQRMAFLTGIDFNAHPKLTKDEQVSLVFDELFRYANTYSIANAKEVENRMPIWYIMDEVGSAVSHSNDPSFRIVPFIHIARKATYSLMFPIKDCKHEEFATRNFVEELEGQGDANTKLAMQLLWKHVDFTQKSFQHVNVTPEYFLEGHEKETLPVLEEIAKIEPKSTKPMKVFTEYKFVHQYLTCDHFQLVASEDEADILWFTSHFKKFEELSKTSPHKFVNQFPFEYVLTIKDLLSIVCRFHQSSERTIDVDTLEGRPKWLPITFNLHTELVQFVSYYQARDARNLHNYWIIKPFNLARGLDTHITSSINCILKLRTSGPKIAQLYIHRPVLFLRESVGRVKFDVRYVILLKSVNPLQVFIYNNFFLRFANQPFAMNEFHVYEKHFTVMNYNADVKLKQMLCDEFRTHWRRQYPHNAWSDVEKDIVKMLREVFECATCRTPPCAIAESPQSRALYAADIMLEHDERDERILQPKLLEINWMPDCKRACEYYPEFYNDIFQLLFRNVDNTEQFTRL